MSLKSFILCATSPTMELDEDSSGVNNTPVEPHTVNALCKPSRDPSRIPQTSACTCLKLCYVMKIICK